MRTALRSEVQIRDREDARMPTIGDVIDGRYELVRDLGSGGAGVVFEARHVFTRRVVAIKVVRVDGDAATRSELRARLLREARALAAARHSGIVEVLDAGVDREGTPFLVLERLEGRTLEGLLATRGRISATDTAAIGLQLAQSLAAAHRAGVVHRDVKPSNVFVIRDAAGREHTKLVDFGTAQVDDPSDRKLSLVGALIGTPEYMSPEQLMASADVDKSSDIYALGVTLYECLTGSVPYSGHYAQVLLQSASQTPIPSVRGLAVDAPEPLAEIVDRALAKNRGARFADMDAFAAALDRLAGSRRRLPALLGPPPLPAGSGGDPSQRRRYARAAYVTPIRLLVDARTVDGRSEDISEGGMLVLCRGECPEGRPVDVRFASPIDGKIVSLHGTVRWLKSQDRGEQFPRALGVEFDKSMPDEVRQSIARYVAMMQDPASLDRAAE